MARVTTLSFLLVFFLSAAAYAANATAVTVSELLQGADTYSYTLGAGRDSVKVKTVSGETFGTVLEGEGGGLKKDAKGEWIADPHLSTRIAPFVVQQAFTTGKQGDVFIEVQVDGKKHKLYATDTADAVYALRLLGPPQMFDKWLDAHAPLDGTLENLSGDLSAKTKKAKADGLAEAAKQAYAAKRPALMRKFARSYLYYKPAPETAWKVRQSKDGKTFYAVTAAADLMYMAQFWFRFTKGADGRWENDKVFGEEIFKGE